MRMVVCAILAGILSSPFAVGQEELSAKERSKLEDEKAAAAVDAAVVAPVVEPAPAPKPEAPAIDVPEETTPPPPAAEIVPAKPAPSPEAPTEPDSPNEVKPPQPDVAPDGLSPLPVAIISTVLDTCMPTLRGERGLVDGLPKGAENGVSDETVARFIARPQSGDYWTVPTLEGPMLLGNLHEREGACQVMASTPLGAVVMDKVTNALGSLESPFTVSDETGEDFGTPIHWRRFISAENDYVDVLHYKGVPGGVASTIHVIVG